MTRHSEGAHNHAAPTSINTNTPAGTGAASWKSLTHDEVLNQALRLSLRYEGGYSNVPQDTGGATNMGITHATYDAYRRDQGLPRQDVRNITREEVRDIYKTRYWDRAGCEDLFGGVLSGRLVVAHFDATLNMGGGRSVLILASAIAKSLGIDAGLGNIASRPTGAQVLRARQFTNSHLAELKSGAISEQTVLDNYMSIRGELFQRFASRGGQNIFLRGWMNRLNSLAGALQSSPNMNIQGVFDGAGPSEQNPLQRFLGQASEFLGGAASIVTNFFSAGPLKLFNISDSIAEFLGKPKAPDFKESEDALDEAIKLENNRSQVPPKEALPTKKKEGREPEVRDAPRPQVAASTPDPVILTPKKGKKDLLGTGA